MSESAEEFIKWLIRVEDERQIGPYSTRTILKMIQDGALTGTEKIKKYPDGKWTQISKHSNFYDLLLETLEKVKEKARTQPQSFEDYLFLDQKNESAIHDNEVSGSSGGFRGSKNGEGAVTKIIPAQEADQNENDENDEFERTQIFGSNKKGFQVRDLENKANDDVTKVFSNEVGKNLKINETTNTSLKVHESEGPGIQVVGRKEVKKEGHRGPTFKTTDLRKSRLKKIIFVSAGIISLFLVFLLVTPSSDTTGRRHLMVAKDIGKTLTSEEIKNYFNQAIKGFEQSSFESLWLAQKKLIEIIEANPKNAEARGTLCLVYKELWPFVIQDSKDLDALFLNSKLARSIDPTSINSLYCEVVKLQIQGKNKEARGVVDYALNISKFAQSEILYDMKSELLMIEGDPRSAISYAEKASSSWPEWVKPQATVARSQALINNFSDATIKYKNILSKYPDHRTLMIELGSLLIRRMNLPNEAFEILNKAINLKNVITPLAEAEASYALSLYYSGTSNLDKAKNFAQRAFRLNPSDSLIKENFIKLGGNLDFEKNGVDYRDLMFLADQHMRVGQCLVAQAEFKSAFELDPKNGEAAMKAAQCLWDLNQTAEAIVWMRKAVAAQPQLIRAFVLLADFLSSRFDYFGAIEILNKASQMSGSNNNEILRTYGLIELRRNNLRDAIGFLTRANKQSENDIATLVLLAKAYLAEGNFTDAQKASVRAIELDSTNIEAQVVYAQMLIQYQGVDAAILYLKELIKKYSYTLNYRLALADILREQDRAVQAQELYDQVLLIDPRNKSALIGLGLSYQAQGVFDKALKQFLTSSIYDPSDVEGLVKAGILYLESQKFTDAVNQFKRAQSINTLYPRLNFYIGKAYFKAGDLEQALKFAMDERKQNPNIADSYILAAEIFMELKQFQKCATEYQQAIKLRPQGASLYVKIAKCYRQSGSPEIAESMLSIAAGQESGLPEIYKEQGAVFETKGDVRGAVEAYNKYLTLSPNAPDKSDIENRILNLSK